LAAPKEFKTKGHKKNPLTLKVAGFLII